MKCAKPKTKKLSENKFKGIKITDIGKQNEEQKKKGLRNPQYRVIITWSCVQELSLALVIGQEVVLSSW